MIDPAKAPSAIRDLVIGFKEGTVDQLEEITASWPGYLKVHAIILRRMGETARTAMLDKYKHPLKKIADEALVEEDEVSKIYIILVCLSDEQLDEVIATFDVKIKRETGYLS